MDDSFAVSSPTSAHEKPPFFIMGCVRSGTTLLRDVIASHPLLFSPNETHFYRFADPYGTMAFIRPLLNQRIFLQHRAADNIPEDQFRDDVLLASYDRGELMERYGQAYLKAQNAPPDARWFDKTPQNVYGALLIAHDFPTAKFIHIVRNPLNVISSLRTSGVMEIKETVGAANYWLEAAIIMRSLRVLLGDRLLELNYEKFTTNPKSEIRKVMDFVEEDSDELEFDLKQIKREKNRYVSTLSDEDIDIARRICGGLAKEYGFEL
ncbi:MAG: sulfotransferase [Pseudomonadota bacterium]